MPTYEFRCPNGHEFERFYRKISDGQATVECPQCHAMAERMMSAGGGLLFRGSGFYITDYGKDGKKDQRDKAKAASDASSPAPSSAATSGSGDPAAPKGEARSGSKGESKSDARSGSKGESAPAAKPDKPAAAPKKSSSNE